MNTQAEATVNFAVQIGPAGSFGGIWTVRRRGTGEITGSQGRTSPKVNETAIAQAVGANDQKMIDYTRWNLLIISLTLLTSLSMSKSLCMSMTCRWVSSPRSN